MLQEKPFEIICDNCGAKPHKSKSPSKKIAEQKAMEENYYFLGKKHYCENCYSFDENDNIILTPLVS